MPFTFMGTWAIGEFVIPPAGNGTVSLATTGIRTQPNCIAPAAARLLEPALGPFAPVPSSLLPTRFCNHIHAVLASSRGRLDWDTMLEDVRQRPGSRRSWRCSPLLQLCSVEHCYKQ